MVELPPPELDGLWKVERVSGLLPPMYSVRKRIRGDRGVTCIGPLPGLPFRIVGLTLRYRMPPRLVDHIEPAGRDGSGRTVYDGRALLFGRELGRFRMTKIGG